jgi:hypothetical protein
MTPSTIERAFELARSGQIPDLPSLKRRLKSDGCRAVDALLAPRILSGHLAAICAAAFKPLPTNSAPTRTSPKSELEGVAIPPDQNVFHDRHSPAESDSR